MHFQIEDDGEGPPSSAGTSSGAFRFRLQPFCFVVSTTSGALLPFPLLSLENSLLKPMNDLPQPATMLFHKFLRSGSIDAFAAPIVTSVN